VFLVITDLLKEHGINVPGSARTLVDMDQQAINLMASRRHNNCFLRLNTYTLIFGIEIA